MASGNSHYSSYAHCMATHSNLQSATETPGVERVPYFFMHPTKT